jgi:hypothetical protein
LKDLPIFDPAQNNGFAVCINLRTRECELTSVEIAGTSVEVAKEILQIANPNEVLVSSTVKDLVLGSGFQFLEGMRSRIGGGTVKQVVVP